MKNVKYLLMAAGIAGMILTTQAVYSENREQVQETVMQAETFLQLDDLIGKNENVVVDFGTTWCPHCKDYDPIFKEVAEEYKGVVFCEVILDKIPSKPEQLHIISKYQARYVPKTSFFKNGTEVHSQIGFMKKEELSHLIERYLLQ